MDLPIAHIVAQDPTLALPLREYLEINGCAVVINRNPSIPPTYHIVVGDKSFVKETVARTPKKSIQIFAIIFLDRSMKRIPEDEVIHAKLAFVRPQTLDTREIERIFAYFITGGSRPYYSVGSHLPDTLVRAVPAQIPVEEYKADLCDEDKPAAMQDAYRRDRSSKHHDTHGKGAISQVIDELFIRPPVIAQPHSQSGMKHIHTGGTPSVFFVPVPAVSRRVVHSIVLFVVIIFFLPFIWYIMAVGFVGVRQMQAFESINNRNADALEKAAVQTTYWSEQGKRSLQLMGSVAGRVGLVDMLRNQERLLSVAAGLGEVEMRAARLMRESVTLVPLVFHGSNELRDAPLLVAVERIRTGLDDLSTVMGLVSAQLESLGEIRSFPFQFISGSTVIPLAQSQVSRALLQVSQARSLLSLYRAGGGFDGKKTYLLLFQNSMELRPTGGFIGSLATSLVENGRMEPLQIQDVYTVDGQLKGHIDPPIPIRELLNQEHWYLRDSNWNPDFRVSGEKAAWFYEKETGVNVDGVIAVSTPLLTALLEAIGPVQLSDYNDRITKDNFFGKSLFYTNADFFPGSTQKKDFLASLGTALLGELITVRTDKGNAVFQAISQALAAGDIQFWFPESKLQGLVEQAGWAGKRSETTSCQLGDTPCAVNSIAIIEANMGVNKVNAYIRRTMKSRVDIDEQGVIDGSVTIAFENSSTNDAAITGGGVYLNYLRGFFPRDTLIVSVTQDGREIVPKQGNARKQQYPYRDPHAVEDGQTVVSLAHTVVPMSSRTITIRYQLATPLTFTGNKGVFMHILRKQPGVTQTAVDMAIGYPSSWVAVPDQSDGVRSDNGFLANAKEVRYNTTLDQTRELLVAFRK